MIHYGKIIRKLLNEKYRFIHPEDSNIHGLSHIQWTAEPVYVGSSGRNAVLVGENALDRSPCGTGTSARMAQWYAKGRLKKVMNLYTKATLALNLLVK
ncbi:proline racemase family protein [Sphingobacterium sp. E70]|nr:proline racemase family protein [Sphingobacterium sp. E70]ULT26247.1 proline racemase family protein [Sphingobacterium sp. E70]